jgi:SAM-dependent methyltransferase
MTETKPHWESIHQTKAPTQVSWYQEHPTFSLGLIKHTGIDKTSHIIDVGGGISTLVDDLLKEDFNHITVLDISSAALQVTRQRLADAAARVTWIEADITQAVLPYQKYDLWHDRAVFHFLIQPYDRDHYIDTVRHAVRVGGHVIIATFAPDGPDRCSGLKVVRYSPESLHGTFGDDFELMDSTRETHHTPFGTEQKFIYCYCR